MSFFYCFLLNLAYAQTGSTCYNGYYLSNDTFLKNVSSFISISTNSSSNNTNNTTTNAINPTNTVI